MAAEEGSQSELDKMVSGQLYNPADPELVHKRWLARRWMAEFSGIPYDDLDQKRKAYESFFGAAGKNLFIEPPFYCDYGFNIYWGDQSYANFNCVFLDCAPIHIGSRVFMAPAVQLYTATHPVEHEARNSGVEFAKPISIGDDVWIGGGAIVNPGVTIGHRSVIGSGSVVARDIPDDVVAVGNPARVVRRISD